MTGGLLSFFRRPGDGGAAETPEAPPSVAELTTTADPRDEHSASHAERLAGIEREIAERLASAEPDSQALVDLREQRDALRRESDRQELLNGAVPDRLAKRLRESESEHDRLTRRIAAVEARVAELRTERDDAEAAVLRQEALTLYAGADARLAERDRVLEAFAAIQRAETRDALRWTEIRARLRQLHREHAMPRDSKAPWCLGARDVLRSVDYLVTSRGVQLWPADDALDRIPLAP